jgi:hypothetical protein
MTANRWSPRDLYCTLGAPGAYPLRDAHAALDTAVRAAYGMAEQEDPLPFLLRLNLELAQREAKGEHVLAPGLPAFVASPENLTTQDCIRADTVRPL